MPCPYGKQLSVLASCLRLTISLCALYRSSIPAKPGALPKIGAGGGAGGGAVQENSGRSTASAKQLYMSKSRYMPGELHVDAMWHHQPSHAICLVSYMLTQCGVISQVTLYAW